MVRRGWEAASLVSVSVCQCVCVCLSRVVGCVCAGGLPGLAGGLGCCVCAVLPSARQRRGCSAAAWADSACVARHETPPRRRSSPSGPCRRRACGCTRATPRRSMCGRCMKRLRAGCTSGLGPRSAPARPASRRGRRRPRRRAWLALGRRPCWAAAAAAANEGATPSWMAAAATAMCRLATS